ncbi:hypothetical protein G6F65_013898 [Rhizopus arrhizus]|nr:hypothetical protein G6F65_013898 [Rhizopus arrhizus]
MPRLRPPGVSRQAVVPGVRAGSGPGAASPCGSGRAAGVDHDARQVRRGGARRGCHHSRIARRPGHGGAPGRAACAHRPAPASL